MSIRMRRAAAGALALVLGGTIATAASAQSTGSAQLQTHRHSHSTGGPTARDQIGLAVVRAATAAYHDVRIAQANGYAILADTAG